MEIRNYREEDYPSIKRNLESEDMFDDVWDSKENVESLGSESNVLVAEQDGELIGSLFIDQFGSQVAFIFRLVVDQKHRNKGVATALINKAQEVLKARGTKEVALLVDAENTALQSFYGKKDYKLGKHSYKTMWRSID